MVDHQLAEWLEEGYVASFRTACLILGNRADAEEAVQDAYLRAWRFRDSLSAVPSIRPWLYRVVVNSCYSKLRREIPTATAGPVTSRWPTWPRRADGPETRRSSPRWPRPCWPPCSDCPLSLRVPVVLRYYADLSERDIALAIGRRQGTVKSRLHEARRRLAADPALCALAGAGDADPQRGDRPMTMLDDDRLASLLARAGDAFEVPASGAADIVARARPPGPGPRGRQGGGGRRRHGRTRDREPRTGARTAGCTGWSPSPPATASCRPPPASSWRWSSPARWGRWCARRRARR